MALRSEPIPTAAPKKETTVQPATPGTPVTDLELDQQKRKSPSKAKELTTAEQDADVAEAIRKLREKPAKRHINTL